jgi:hypothetical protein
MQLRLVVLVESTLQARSSQQRCKCNWDRPRQLETISAMQLLEGGESCNTSAVGPGV